MTKELENLIKGLRPGRDADGMTVAIEGSLGSSGVWREGMCAIAYGKNLTADLNAVENIYRLYVRNVIENVRMGYDERYRLVARRSGLNFPVGIQMPSRDMVYFARSLDSIGLKNSVILKDREAVKRMVDEIGDLEFGGNLVIPEAVKRVKAALQDCLQTLQRSYLEEKKRMEWILDDATDNWLKNYDSGETMTLLFPQEKPSRPIEAPKKGGWGNEGKKL